MLYIKHLKFKDICVQVDEIENTYSGALRVTGSYVNMGFVKSWPMYNGALFYIKKSEVNNWLICDRPKVCLRDAIWR